MTIVLMLLSMLGVPHATYRHSVAGVELPDPKVTPGAVRTTSEAELCAKGFTTKKYRHTTHAMKLTAYARYGQHWDAAEFEVDHLIPLTIGGADDLGNLWPQRAEPRPGYHEKDRLEVRLHSLMCKHKISAKEAQSCIRDDWWSCWQKVKP